MSSLFLRLLVEPLRTLRNGLGLLIYYAQDVGLWLEDGLFDLRVMTLSGLAVNLVSNYLEDSLVEDLD